MAESNVVRFEDRLLNSIQTFKNEEAKSLLNKDLVTAKTHYGSLLHYAAKYDNDDIARHLIEMGSDVDNLGRRNQTPLIVAVLHTNKKCVKVLLDAGANVDFPNEKGQTAFKLLFDSDYVAIKDIFRLFLNGLKTQYTLENLAIKLMDAGCTFRYVARENDYNLMASMLKCGAEINSKSFVNKTALHAAIEIKNLRWVKWLLENGTNLNVVDEIEKNTLLLLACYEADIVTLQLLLEEGVNPNGLIKGKTIRWMEGKPLCELLSKTDLDKCIVTACIELLFQYGAVPRNPSDGYWSIFDYAFLSGDSVWAKYLIARLVMLEKMGTSIDLSNLLRCHFPDNQAKLASLPDYYNECKNVLEIILFRNLSLFHLLTVKESNIRSYVRNDEFITEVKKVCLQQEIDKLYPYYYNALIRRINEAIDGVKLEDVAIPILCDLFGLHENECYIVARKITGELKRPELEQIIQLKNEI